jgi:hypothetical protein
MVLHEMSNSNGAQKPHSRGRLGQATLLGPRARRRIVLGLVLPEATCLLPTRDFDNDDNDSNWDAKDKQHQNQLPYSQAHISSSND